MADEKPQAAGEDEECCDTTAELQELFAEEDRKEAEKQRGAGGRKDAEAAGETEVDDDEG